MGGELQFSVPGGVGNGLRSRHTLTVIVAVHV
jgi:hypothetical protein